MKDFPMFWGLEHPHIYAQRRAYYMTLFLSGTTLNQQ